MMSLDYLRNIPEDVMRTLSGHIRSGTVDSFQHDSISKEQINDLIRLFKTHSTLHTNIWKRKSEDLNLEDLKDIYDRDMARLKSTFIQAQETQDKEMLSRFWAGQMLCCVANAPLISAYRCHEIKISPDVDFFKDKELVFYMSLTPDEFFEDLYPRWCKIHKVLLAKSGIDTRRVGVMAVVVDYEEESARRIARDNNFDLDTQVFSVPRLRPDMAHGHGFTCCYRFYALFDTFTRLHAKVGVISDVDVVLDTNVIKRVFDADADVDLVLNYHGAEDREMTLNFAHAAGGASIFKNTPRTSKLLSHFKSAFDISLGQALRHSAIDQTALDYALLTLDQVSEDFKICTSSRAKKIGGWPPLRYGRPRLLVAEKSGPISGRIAFLDKFMQTLT